MTTKIHIEDPAKLDLGQIHELLWSISAADDSALLSKTDRRLLKEIEQRLASRLRKAGVVTHILHCEDQLAQEAA